MKNTALLETLRDVLSYGATCLLVEQIESTFDHLVPSAKADCDLILSILKGDKAKDDEGFHPSENYPRLQRHHKFVQD